MITTSIESITPAVAKAYLTHSNPNNRHVRARVKSYARTMSVGAWRETHQGIAFNHDGTLLDGHHRLQAVVLSGVTVRMMVTRGLPMSELDGIDRGQARTMRHLSKMIDGYPGPDVLQCARQFISIESQSVGGMADADIVTVALKLEDAWSAVAHIEKLRVRVGVRVGLIMIAIRDRDKASLFVDAYIAAKERTEVPSYGVRNMLRWIERAPKHGSLESEELFASAVIRGYEQWLEGGVHFQIKTNSDMVIREVRAIMASWSAQ